MVVMVVFCFERDSRRNGPEISALYKYIESTIPHSTPNFPESDYFFAVICSRNLWPCSLNSGVRFSPKSFASYTGRISTSVPPSNGARFTHSTASSIERTCQIQYPAINSLVSVNGPSVTVRLLPENFTRLPFEVGSSPSPARMTPDFTSSSLYFSILVSPSVSGSTPASDSLLAFTMTMLAHVSSPVLYFERAHRPQFPLYRYVEPNPCKSTTTESNFALASGCGLQTGLALRCPEGGSLTPEVRRRGYNLKSCGLMND